ncbi:hypothetical protein LTR94_025115, partial [Friedmanniomyces endolithicus]
MHLSKRRIGLGLMTTTLLATSPVLAETIPSDLSSVDPQATSVSDVVVTASGSAVDIRNAPASVSVITREDIERQPVQNLGELLGRLPGVNGGIGSEGEMSKITIRGLPDNYTLVLVDGRRVGNSRDISYRPDLGRQDLNWISPDMIERIEVVRGPMSSLYGSDAMGGVINIITRKIAPTWRGSANTSYTWSEDSERGDAYQLGVNVAGPLTENLGLRLGATYARTNPDEVNISGANGTGGVVNKSLNGVLNWAPVENHNFSFEANYGVEEPLAPKLLVPNRNGVLTPQGAFGSETERTNFRASHGGEWSFGKTRLDVYRNAFENKAMGEEGGNGEFSEWIVDGLWNFEKNFIWQHKFAIGAQYRQEELTNTDTIGNIPIDFDGTVITGATLKGDTAAIFAEDQITLRENLLLTLGGVTGFAGMRINNNPDIDFPLVAVTAARPGAAPTEMEVQVTRVIEDSIAGLSGVRHIYSNVSDGVSSTTIEFELGTDTERATNDVRNAMSGVRASLPQDMQEPTVQRIDITGDALITYVVRSETMTPEQISWFIDNEMSRALLALGGVGEVNRSGGVDREIRVELDPEIFFLLFVPPLLFLDGWRIPKDELFRDASAVLGLALGLVFLTVLGMGLFIHWMIPAVPYAVAFALAAVVSPTDPIAVSAIAQKAPIPKRMMHILEGESLLNDASGLVCLRFAVAAALTGAFSLTSATLTFLWMAVSGV